MKVGYIRVPSVDQNSDRQLDGIELEKIFEEKVSGKDRDREQLKLCIDYLREGDILYCHSIDRLARSQRDLLNIVDELVNKGVVIKFVTEDMEIGKNGNPMAEFMFSVLGSFAEFERKMIKSRQREGIRKAKERGQKFGRRALKPKLIKEINNRRAKGQSVQEISLALNVGPSTIYKYLSDDLKQKVDK